MNLVKLSSLASKCQDFKFRMPFFQPFYQINLKPLRIGGAEKQVFLWVGHFELKKKKRLLHRRNQQCTVVHLTDRMGAKSLWAGASLWRRMSKEFLALIHSAKEGNIDGSCGLSTIINFTPKKHKIRKIGYFQLAWNILNSLLTYHNQQNIVSTDHK